MTFTDHLNRFVSRSQYSTGQLANLTGLAQRTIANWLQGHVSRPRHAEDLLKLGVALHLSSQEMNCLLQAAHHSSIEHLREIISDTTLLSYWKKETPIPFQVGPLVPYFVGRHAEIEMLRQHLTNRSENRLCVIYGMGGVGKTTLAIRIAYELRDEFEDGILWAHLRDADVMTILHNFAMAYGLDVSAYRNLEERQNYVRSLLVNRRCLIILDDVDSSQTAMSLIPPNGTAATLITTRHNNLNVARGAFHLPLRVFSNELSDSHAIFRQIVPQQNLPNPDEIMALAEMLGHLPLALAIAASRIAYEPFWTVQTFIQHLNERGLQALEHESDSIQASIDLTVDQLSQEQQHVFCALSLFAQHSFSPDAVQFLFEDRLDTPTILRQLHQLSLLQTAQHQRYQLHPLLHDYANQRMEQLPESDHNVLQQRFITFYDRYLHENGYHYGRIDDEAPLITQALHLAFETHNYSLIASILSIFSNYLQSRGLGNRADLYVVQAIQMARAHQNDEFLCELLEYDAYRSNLKGHYQAAAKAILEGLGLAERLENEDRQHAYWMAICALHKVFDSQTSQPYRHKLENLLSHMTDSSQALYLSNLLGVVAWREGDYILARSHLHHALSLSNTLQQKTPSIQKMESLIRLNLARTALSEQKCAEAQQLLEDALPIAQEFAYPPNIGLIYEAMSQLSEMQVRLDDAIAHAKNSLKIMQTINFDAAILRLHHRLMCYALQNGDVATCKQHLQTIVNHAHEVERLPIAHATQTCLQEIQDDTTVWQESLSFHHLKQLVMN